MKKYQIAMVGTFDLENYGDLLFPIVFEEAMKKRGLKFDLTLFSAAKTSIMPLVKDRKVYSLIDFENLNEKLHFDTLVVGGGAIIHFVDGFFKIPEEEKYDVYHVVNVWLPYIYLAAKHNIKIIFNLPQVPERIPTELRRISRAVFDQIDYIAVRDKYSKNFIEEIYEGNVPEIKVYPDTVMILDEFFPKGELVNVRTELGLKNRYMVFHQQGIEDLTDEQFRQAKNIIEDAMARGVDVVLLPIGNTHGDLRRLNSINTRLNNRCTLIKNNLSLIEITAVLAGAEYYVGCSFHGSVVTMIYGGKAFGLRYCLKDKELYGSAGLTEYLDSDFVRLLKKADRVLKGELTYEFPKAKLQKLTNEHFDNVYKVIVGEKTKTKDANRILEELGILIPFYREEEKRLIGEKEELKTQVRDLEIKNKELILDQKNNIKKYERDIHLLRESRAFKIGKKITWLPHKIIRGKEINGR